MVANDQRLRIGSRCTGPARLSRDPRFDGKFFIAVKTTKIYCRPICPSPTSKSSNVRYYATAPECAEAGFRPCLRCRPEVAPGTPAWLGTPAVVRRALRLIHDGALDDNSVVDLADRIGVGARHLNRLFAQHVGASPIAIAQTRRLQFAKRLLDETKLPITDIALASGYGSVRRFNHSFQQTYRRTPSDLRQRQSQSSDICAHSAEEVVLRFVYRPPYDWRHVLDFLATRAVPGIERVDATSYARTVWFDGVCGWIEVVFPHDEASLELRVHGAEPTALFRACAAARRMFDLSADPALIEQAFAADRLLGPLIRACPGIRIVGAWDPFECTVRAVIGQQISVAAARTITARLVAKAGIPIRAGFDGLTHAFPTAQQLAGAPLSGLGLTPRRCEALRALARVVAAEEIDWNAPTENVTAALAALPGVGMWTAQYVALRALGEPDAFSAGDLVLRRLCAADETRVTERALEARAEKWRPWRGYAVMHLWQAAGDAKRARHIQSTHSQRHQRCRGRSRNSGFVPRSPTRLPAASRRWLLIPSIQARGWPVSLHSFEMDAGRGTTT